MRPAFFTIIWLTFFVYLFACNEAEYPNRYKVVYLNGDTDTLIINHSKSSFLILKEGDIRISQQYTIIISGVRWIKKID